MTEIETGLLITAFGMGLVFLLIIVLWGLMAFLVKITSSKPGKQSEPPEEIPTAQDQDLARKYKAAAAAVAYALTKQAQKKRSILAPKSTTNLWQAHARQQQLQIQLRRGKHL